MALGKSSRKPQTGDEKVKYYHSKYITYSRAIAVLWAILVVCFLIVCLVCLIQPAWIGYSLDSPGEGHFGLWSYYVPNSETTGSATRNSYTRHGEFLDFSQIPSGHFQAATVFVGLTVLLMIICIICLFLFCCVSNKIVFIVCGWILAVCAIFLFLACVIYPGGFDADVVKAVCQSDSYDKGNCVIQWAYILAIIGIFDAIVLAILAFVLAFKQVKLLPWQEKVKSPEPVYIVDDRRSGYGNGTMRSAGPQPVKPVVIVSSADSVHSQQPVGTLRSHKSHHSNGRNNFQL